MFHITISPYLLAFLDKADIIRNELKSLKRAYGIHFKLFKTFWWKGGAMMMEGRGTFSKS